MISVKKRGAVYGVIGLMLCVAVYLNWSYFQSPTELTVAAQMDGEDAETTGEVYGEVTAVSGSDKSASDKSTSASKTESTKDSSSDSGFAQARLNRQTARDKAISILKETLEDDNATDAERQETTSRISTIAANSIKESKIEGKIQSKGFSDAVVYIEDDSISASVAPSGSELTETDVAKIADIIVAETGADLSIIKISGTA